MAKSKTVFACTLCGHAQPKWFGRCPQCDEWNTAVEETTRPETNREAALQRDCRSPEKALPLSEISGMEADRRSTGLSEVDRVLGGGVLPGSVILLGGEPGI
ncbi:MAG: DNA repair protein RadA, partial [Candidatus Omnitrophica bacterium]|nr:DNA repair protein RadA [Candidatus Omnitrophota bacterium]